jgi:hypothetical protein
MQILPQLLVQNLDDLALNYQHYVRLVDGKSVSMGNSSALTNELCGQE